MGINEQHMKTTNHIEEERYSRAKKKVERIKGFYRHLIVYFSINILITSIHVVNDMRGGTSFITAFWDLQTFFTWIPWGVGLMIHGIVAFDIFSFFLGNDWEDKKVKELMEKDYKDSTTNWE